MYIRWIHDSAFLATCRLYYKFYIYKLLHFADVNFFYYRYRQLATDVKYIFISIFLVKPMWNMYACFAKTLTKKLYCFKAIVIMFWIVMVLLSKQGVWVQWIVKKIVEALGKIICAIYGQLLKSCLEICVSFL